MLELLGQRACQGGGGACRSLTFRKEPDLWWSQRASHGPDPHRSTMVAEDVLRMPIRALQLLIAPSSA